MASYDEEIYETSSLNDDRCSLIEEGYWYENDLLLAAELGKTLLERNKTLETQLNAQTQNTMNMRMEIDLLKKQLETLRELNRNKMMLYEDVDRNSNELELNNKQLHDEARKLHDRIKTLSVKNNYLEQQLDEKTGEIEEIQRSMFSSSPARKLSNVSTSTNPTDAAHPIDEKQSFKCKQCAQLTKTLHNTELQMEIKICECEELQTQLDQLLRQYHLVQVELEDLKSFQQLENKPVIRRSQHKNSLEEDLYNNLEYDIDKVEENPIQIGELQSGGKILTGHQTMSTISDRLVVAPSTEPGQSLLTELDNKYTSLVLQYETLLSQSSQSPVVTNDTPTPATASPSAFHTKLNHIFSEETRAQRKLLTTQDYRPKYKQLFREAFDLLKDMKSPSNISN